MSEAADESSQPPQSDGEDEQSSSEYQPTKVLIDDPLARFEEAKAESIKRKSKETAVTDFNERWDNMYDEFRNFPPGTWRPSNFYGYIRENGTAIGKSDLSEAFFQPQRSDIAFEYLPLKMAKKIMMVEEEDKLKELSGQDKQRAELQRILKSADEKKEKDWRTYDEIGRLIITPSPKLVEFLAQEDKKELDDQTTRVVKRRHQLAKQQKTIQDTKKGKVKIMELVTKTKSTKIKEKRRECKPKDSKVKDTDSQGNVIEGQGDETKLRHEESETKILKSAPGEKSKREKKSKKQKEKTTDVNKEKQMAHKKSNRAHISGRVPKEPCFQAQDGVMRKKRIPLRVGLFKQVNFCKKTLPPKNVDWADSTLTLFYGQKKFRFEPPPITHILTEEEKSRRFAEIRRRPVGLDYNYLELRKARRGFLEPKKSPWPCKVDPEIKNGGHILRALPPMNCCKPKPKSKHSCYCRRVPWIGWSFPGCCQVWPRTPFGVRKPKKPKIIDKKKWGWWIEKEGTPPIPETETVYFIVRRKSTHMYFMVKDSLTLNDLKRMIEGVIYVAPRDQRLYHNLSRLHGSMILSDIGFSAAKHGRSNPAVLFLRIKKKGKWERLAIAKLSTACPVPPSMEAKKEEIKMRIHKMFNEQYVPWEMFMPRKIRRLLTNPIHENDFKPGRKAKDAKSTKEDQSEIDVSAPGDENTEHQPDATENSSAITSTVELSNLETEKPLEAAGSHTQLKKSSSHFLDFFD